MSTMQKQATDILAKLTAAANESELVMGATAICKEAGLAEDDTAFTVSFVKQSEAYLKLTAEELVKRALDRFMTGRNTDALLKGIKSAAASDQHLAAAAVSLLGKQELKSGDDAALADALCKRAYTEPGAMPFMGGAPSMPGPGMGAPQAAPTAGHGVNEFWRSIGQGAPHAPSSLGEQAAARAGQVAQTGVAGAMEHGAAGALERGAAKSLPGAIERRLGTWGTGLLRHAGRATPLLALGAAGAYGASKGWGAVKNWLNSKSNEGYLDGLRSMTPGQLAQQAPQMLKMLQSGQGSDELNSLLERAIAYRQNPWLGNWSA